MENLIDGTRTQQAYSNANGFMSRIFNRNQPKTLVPVSGLKPSTVKTDETQQVVYHTIYNSVKSLYLSYGKSQQEADESAKKAATAGSKAVV